MSLMSFTITIRGELYCMINYPVTTLYCIISKFYGICYSQSITPVWHGSEEIQVFFMSLNLTSRK